MLLGVASVLALGRRSLGALANLECPACVLARPGAPAPSLCPGLNLIAGSSQGLRVLFGLGFMPS